MIAKADRRKMISTEFINFWHEVASPAFGGNKAAFARAIKTDEGNMRSFLSGKKSVTDTVVLDTAAQFDRAAKSVCPSFGDIAAVPIAAGGVYVLPVIGDLVAHEKWQAGLTVKTAQQAVPEEISVTEGHWLYVMPDSSMAPPEGMSSDYAFLAGDIALIEPDSYPEQNSMVLAVHDKQLVLRQLIGDALVPISRLWRPIQSDYHVLGRVAMRHSLKTF